MSGGDSGFSPRAVLGLVVFGAAAFLALLWMIGSGMAGREPEPSGAHAAGKGLHGFAALAAYMERRGFEVEQARSRGALRQAGVLVLTPLLASDPERIEAAVALHRQAGPTVVIMPKWRAFALPPQLAAQTREAKGKHGWVRLLGASAPSWPGFHDEIGLKLGPMLAGSSPGRWRGGGLSGTLPRSDAVISGEFVAGQEDEAWPLVPLVVGESDGRVLAAYVADGNNHYGLDNIAEGEVPVFDEDVESDGSHPLIFVFDPDLFNNYGLSGQANALLAERLLRAALDGDEPKLIFDLTLAGYDRAENLLTLAFTPPFLAATACLMLAALVLGWRALNRFGPPLASARAIAFGKRALVENAAGLVRRARRLHLVGPPYADAARERLARALALAHRLDPAATEAAIDRALASRAPDAEAFSTAAAAMRAARRPTDLLRAAQTLHSLERILTR